MCRSEISKCVHARIHDAIASRGGAEQLLLVLVRCHALTAIAFEEDREAILAAGCDELVRKPFREAAIFDVLNRFLGIRFIQETYNHGLAGIVSMKELKESHTRLPEGWADRMISAIIALDVDLMRDLIQDIVSHTPDLAEMIGNLVNNFEYEKIISLIKAEEDR